jgi:hypothetical protein
MDDADSGCGLDGPHQAPGHGSDHQRVRMEARRESSLDHLRRTSEDQRKAQQQHFSWLPAMEKLWTANAPWKNSWRLGAEFPTELPAHSFSTARNQAVRAHRRVQTKKVRGVP